MDVGSRLSWGLSSGTSDPRVGLVLVRVSDSLTSDGRSSLWDCDGEGRNRTGDTTIFSRVLYQLSYLARGGKG